MNEKEIITALENCTSGKPCKLCPSLHKAHCMTDVMEEALNLIKSYQERMDRIVEQLESLAEEADSTRSTYLAKHDWLPVNLYKGRCNAFDEAIEIVKGVQNEQLE